MFYVLQTYKQSWTESLGEIFEIVAQFRLIPPMFAPFMYLMIPEFK